LFVCLLFGFGVYLHEVIFSISNHTHTTQLWLESLITFIMRYKNQLYGLFAQLKCCFFLIGSEGKYVVIVTCISGDPFPHIKSTQQQHLMCNIFIFWRDLWSTDQSKKSITFKSLILITKKCMGLCSAVHDTRWNCYLVMKQQTQPHCPTTTTKIMITHDPNNIYIYDHRLCPLFRSQFFLQKFKWH
jgi:hypothetical protein